MSVQRFPVLLLSAALCLVGALLCSPQDGNVWEKAGVNVSVVYGSMPPEAYR